VPKTARKPAAPQTISLGNIPTIVTVSPKKGKGNPEVAMQRIADLCAIDRVIEDLEDAKKAIDTSVREEALAMLRADGFETKSRPGNFHGIETEVVNGITLTHSVSVELRNSGAALSDEAIRIAQELNIPTEEKVTTHETYIVNPKYATDIPVMEAVVAALNEAVNAGKIPADILQFQPGNSKTVCTDETLPTIFRLQDREQVEMVLPLFSSLAVGKHKYASVPGKEADLGPALLRTAELINRPGFRDEMTAAHQARETEKKSRRRA
jgi:hypothetical protein